MKSTKAQAALNKARVLDVGSQRFRELGFDGLGVAELMREAGQTHGAFYGQFASKEDFMAEASAKGFEQMLSSWHEAAQRYSKETKTSVFEALITIYLSDAHRDNPGNGCVTAALGADVRRQAPLVRAAVTKGIQKMLDMLAAEAPGTSHRERHENALRTFSGLVGAITIARAVDNPELSIQVLRSTSLGLISNAATERQPT